MRLFPDPRGIAIAAPSAEAVDSLERAVVSLYSLRDDPLALVRGTLKDWPDFALAHVVRALALLGLTERRFAAGASSSLDRAAELMGLNGDEETSRSPATREQTLYRAARKMAGQEWDEAGQLFESLLLANPLDILSLHLAHNVDFFRGNVWNLRNRINRVLPYWRADTPGYPNVLGMHAFGLEECNLYPEAEQAARESLEREPKNPWSVHALAHVLEMQGRAEEGIDHLTGRVDDWARDSGFAYHNWWHLALFHLELDDERAVLALYDAELGNPEASYALNMIDAAALLWRLELLGVDSANRVEPVAGWWRKQLADGAGCYAFNDFHAAVAFLAAGDVDSLAQLAETMADPTRQQSTENRRTIQTLGLPLCQALTQYAKGEFASAAAGLTALRDATQRFGGSHAQRDLITLTLISAAARAGQQQLARHYLNERLVMKPASPFTRRLEACLA